MLKDCHHPHHQNCHDRGLFRPHATPNHKLEHQANKSCNCKSCSNCSRPKYIQHPKVQQSKLVCFVLPLSRTRNYIWTDPLFSWLCFHYIGFLSTRCHSDESQGNFCGDGKSGLNSNLQLSPTSSNFHYFCPSKETLKHIAVKMTRMPFERVLKILTRLKLRGELKYIVNWRSKIWFWDFERHFGHSWTP